VAEYSQFLGCKVTVRYRVGEMLLSASGTFSADSGRSIFLEQHLDQRGTRKYFRWEIPYPYIYRIVAETPAEDAQQNEMRYGDAQGTRGELLRKSAAAGAGDTSSNGSTVIPFPQRPNTA
jgi:hypothetical protein